MRYIYTFLLLSLLASCATEFNKKVLVLGRGKLKVVDNTISTNDGVGSVEQAVDIDNSWKELLVETTAGKRKIDIPAENGYYILNLKQDTLIGSYQRLGSDLGGHTLDQEELKFHIDSLVALTMGENINFAVNFFCLPGQLLKVSSNVDARVYGPYKKIPYQLSADRNGGEPEVYKFYTNTEMRDLIETFKESSIYYPHKPKPKKKK